MTGPGAAAEFPSPEREIRRRIAARGAIPFAEFMSLALYAEGAGYYSRPGSRTGLVRGDFATSPEVSPDFGRRLAIQVGEIAGRLGRSWTLIECGTGRGLLAADLLDGLQEFAGAAAGSLERLILVEPGGAAAEAPLRLRDARVPVRRCRSLSELPAGELCGVAVANELLDALPVHALVRWGGRVREWHVTLGHGGALRFRLGEPTDARLADRVRRYRLLRKEGWRGEVSLEVERFVADLARVLARGAALLVDYGLPAERLADASHAAGTLVAYRRHRVVADLLASPGRQDLTAHVNWTQVEDAAREHGLEPAGRTTQDRALLALGLADDLALRPGEPPELTARRLAARALVMPGPGGGKRFQLQILSRGVPGPFRALAAPAPAVPG